MLLIVVVLAVILLLGHYPSLIFFFVIPFKILITPNSVKPLQRCEGFLYKQLLNLEAQGYISSHEDLPQKESDII